MFLKYRKVVCCLIGITMISALGCSKNETVVATVNETKITASDLQNALDIAKLKYDPLLLNVPSNIEALKRNVLNELIDEAMLMDEAKKLGIDLEESELTALEQDMKQIKLDDNAGLNKKYLKQKRKQRLIIQKMIGKEIRAKIILSPDEIHKYYVSHKKDFNRSLQYHARQIVVDDSKTADMILEKIKEGGDFAALAKEFSLSPDKEDGGDLGFFNASSYPPVFAYVCSKLKINEVSDIIKTEYGFQIFQLLGKTDPYQQSENEAKEEIENLLIETKGAELFEKWYDDVVKKSKVIENEEALKEVKIG